MLECRPCTHLTSTRQFLLQVKWALMEAGCLRRVGRLEDALYRYRAIYAVHPTSMECLRYLVQLSQVSRGEAAAGGLGLCL